MSDAGKVFWQDLARDLEDPELLREYVVESLRIATIDRIVNALDDARQAAGLSKAELARAIGSQPAALRRLFTSHNASPTLGTLAEVAGALGMRVTLTPMDEEEREEVTQSLLDGRSSDPARLAQRLAAMRHSSSSALVS
jgi:transcriptional regulator with XRE-family HTH domain